MTMPDLLTHFAADPACTPDAIFDNLSRLLAAPAPANSCLLPGTVGEVIGTIATELGPALRVPWARPAISPSKSADPAAPLDLLVTSHMDRPGYRVLNLDDATLYPLCAIRVPG